jgi:hypothetical protein
VNELLEELFKLIGQPIPKQDETAKMLAHVAWGKPYIVLPESAVRVIVEKLKEKKEQTS